MDPFTKANPRIQNDQHTEEDKLVGGIPSNRNIILGVNDNVLGNELLGGGNNFLCSSSVRFFSLFT